ncbi:golgin subfamily A member 2-like [Saccopteryx leptura]|uniref:golgin subfamily A member 2-like n=1 Tax=Saccopteryx leptura TaxID=249018 RepID=UPI00339BA78F
MTPGKQNQGALWKERHREEENISRLAEDKTEMKEKPQALRELVVRLSGCKPSEFYVWQGPGAARSPAGAQYTLYPPGNWSCSNPGDLREGSLAANGEPAAYT